MNAHFKEILLILIAVIFLFGGLGITLNFTNGIMLLGIVAIGIGAGLFALVIKGYRRYQ